MGCTPLAEGISVRPPSTSRSMRMELDRWYPGTTWTRSSAACSKTPSTRRSRSSGSAGQAARWCALYDREIKGGETVAVNTVPAGLSKAECDVKILLPHSEDADRVVAARVS